MRGGGGGLRVGAGDLSGGRVLRVFLVALPERVVVAPVQVEMLFVPRSVTCSGG